MYFFLKSWGKGPNKYYQICRKKFFLCRTFSLQLENKNPLKYTSNCVPIMLTYLLFMESCWKKISSYNYSSIARKMSCVKYSNWLKEYAPSCV